MDLSEPHGNAVYQIVGIVGCCRNIMTQSKIWHGRHRSPSYIRSRQSLHLSLIHSKQVTISTVQHAPLLFLIVYTIFHNPEI